VLGLLRIPRLNVNKAILFFEKKTKGVFCMKFGNYKIDSFYLIMIIGFLATSLFFPFMLLSIFVLLIIGLEKDDKEG
ncbi:hypothetical protein, partial [Staphylococcus haemolyticus]